MKLLILILLIVIPCFSFGGLKDRLKAVQKSQEEILQKEAPKQMPLIPTESTKVMEAPIAEESRQNRHVMGDKVTRLEVQQQYMQRDLDKTMQTLQETRDVLIEVVSTLEKANKVTEVQNTKTDHTDLILNIVLGIVGFIVSGGGGYFAWKNKHLIWSKKKENSSDDN